MIRAIVTLFVVLSLAGCGPGEGERCNPLLFEDECGGGPLVCTVPTNCVVSFCCPKEGMSSSESCQACPAPDGGTD